MYLEIFCFNSLDFNKFSLASKMDLRVKYCKYRDDIKMCRDYYTFMVMYTLLLYKLRKLRFHNTKTFLFSKFDVL